MTFKKVLIVTYYWPPSGGSGVQRWMYFAKYLKRLGWEPIVLTVDEKSASYSILDKSLEVEVEGIRVIKTQTREPLRWYSRLKSGSAHKGIPQGEVDTKGILSKVAAFVRGNFFIPDARKGWVPFAVKAAKECIESEKIRHLITTGPPHSAHLIGLALSKSYSLNWWADFRDPWTSIFYNAQLYRSTIAEKRDAAWERKVLLAASGIITTVGGELQQKLMEKAPQQNFVRLPNGFDAELMTAVNGEVNTSYFHIVYTGLLTRNQAYPEFLLALQRIKTQRSICFSLAGNIDDSILKEIKETLPNVRVKCHGYLPHAEAVALMKSGDLLLNFIFEGAQTEMISGKVLEYLATAVPVLSLGDPNSEAGLFMGQGSCAKMISPENTKGLQDFIQTLLNAPKKEVNHYPDLHLWSREALTKRLIAEVLEKE